MPRIDVTVCRDAGWACIDVRDNGPGIPENVAARMFDAFYTSKSSEGGTGLGLAVSRTIADEHGGALMLMPHDERGAWFRLRLPVLKV
jgi:two-component system sensor histidine kinase HupT/HoxJ